jgi:hypothetical protein
MIINSFFKQNDEKCWYLPALSWKANPPDNQRFNAFTRYNTELK